jgi:hypothetical protein
MFFDHGAFGARCEMKGFRGGDRMMESTERVSARVIQHKKWEGLLKASNDVMSHRLQRIFLQV